MFFYLLFLIFCIYIFYELRKVKINSLVEKYQFQLYVLRDELREYVMAGEINKTNWVFDYLDSSISKACDTLQWVNIYRLFVIVITDRNDTKLERAQRHLEKELEKPSNFNLKSIHEKFVEIISNYFYEKHKIIFGFARALIWTINNKPRTLRKTTTFVNKTKNFFKNGIRELTESPETSTLVLFSPAYK